MPKAFSRSRTPAQILDALADVAGAAADLDPNPYQRAESVRLLAWNAARFSQMANHGPLPLGHELCRQLSRSLGRTIGWRAALELALAGRLTDDPLQSKEER